MSQSSWIAPSEADTIRFSQEDFFNPSFQPIDPVALHFENGEKKEAIECLRSKDPEQKKPSASDNNFKSSIVLDKGERQVGTGVEQRNIAQKSQRFARPPEWQNKQRNSRSFGSAFQKKSGGLGLGHSNKARQEYSQGGWNKAKQGQGSSRQEQSRVGGSWRDNTLNVVHESDAQDSEASWNQDQPSTQFENQNQQKPRPSDSIAKQSCNNFVMRLDNNDRGAVRERSKPAQRGRVAKEKHSSKSCTNPVLRKQATNPNSPRNRQNWQQEMSLSRGRGRGVKRGGGLASATREEIEELKRQETSGIISELTERKLLLEEQLEKLQEENSKCKTLLKKTEAENVTVWQKLNDIESDVEGLRKENFQTKDRLKGQKRFLTTKLEECEEKLQLSEERAEKLEANNVELKNGSARLRRRVRELERVHLTGESLLQIAMGVSGFSRNPSPMYANSVSSSSTPVSAKTHSRKKSNRRSSIETSKWAWRETENFRGDAPLQDNANSWTRQLSKLQQPNDCEFQELDRIGNVLSRNGIGCIGDINKGDSDYCTATPPAVDSPTD